MRWWEDEEEWQKIRSGYVSMAEEALFRRLFHLPNKSPQKTNGRAHRAAWSRFRTFDAARAGSGKQQVVVKAVGNTKNRATAAAMLRYVARRREQDRRDGTYGSVRLCDQFGRDAEYPEALGEEWGLKSESQNLKETGEGQKHIQAWHFIFSLAVEEEEDEEELSTALVEAVRTTVSSEFAADGHKVYWGLHRDCPGRPHAHVVVKAESEWGGRLHFDRHGDRFHLLRQAFQNALLRQGVEREATRREDRYETRMNIVQGVEPLRPGKPIHHFKHPPRPTIKRYTRNEGSARGIFNRLREQWRDQNKPTKNQMEVPAIFRERFRDPNLAYGAWYRLALLGARYLPDGTIEARMGSYATWLLAKRPEKFGRLGQNVVAQSTPSQLKKELEAIELPVPGVEEGTVVEKPDVSQEHSRRVKRDRLQMITSLARVLKLHFASEDDPYFFDQSARSLVGNFDLPILPAQAVMPSVKKKRKAEREVTQNEAGPVSDSNVSVPPEEIPVRIEKPQSPLEETKKPATDTTKSPSPRTGRSRTRGY